MAREAGKTPAEGKQGEEMTLADMVPGIPYIVTRGSAWAELRKGDRVELLSKSDAGCLAPTLKVLRNSVSHRWFGSTIGSWEVALDRAGIMERVAKLRTEADKLEEML